MENWPGNPYPLGAKYDGNGVNFALFADTAYGVELCLFDASGNETHRIKVVERTHYIWHLFIPGLKPGQLYGYRVHGPYEPREGFRFNPNKLLIDPYAKALNGDLIWNRSIFGYKFGNQKEDLSFSDSDSAPFVPKCIVVEDSIKQEGDGQINIPLNKTVIYELHVKGFTKLFPGIPEEIRGTYAALGHPEIIQYLKNLGVNAVELMPIHQFVNDKHLVKHGLTNYWGYNSINYFSPHPAYSSADTSRGGHIDEFKNMVRALHREGIEVILDVVYNHTAEGNHLGPTLSFRGIDNRSYYRLKERDKRAYVDYTGTGNTFNTVHPTVLKLVMDSLRYWVTEMHVDGFRFDLATVLAREFDEVDKWGSFFDVIHQDPILSRVKLIAEPWDLGENGYHVGKFPAGWLEWNGKYRDAMREFWRGKKDMLPEFSRRITGSSDLYFENWRRPLASINFVTAHDGFTLRDLVSYNQKHNEANKENSMDGESHNHSWNCGVEGETDDVSIISLRKKQIRNFLTTLFLSQGIPMLTSGDELGKTQKGNNNPYCHDNELSWIDWESKDEELTEFTSGLIKMRLNHPVFCRRRWFRNEPVEGKEILDIEWFLPHGQPMDAEHWNTKFARSIAVFLSGDGIPSRELNGKRIVDDNFYLMFNSYHDVVVFNPPSEKYGTHWLKIIDTHEAYISEEGGQLYKPGEQIFVEGRSVLVFRCP